MATKTTKAKATETPKLTIAQMLQVIAEMTVLELSELVKAIEEKFNVSAMPVMTGPVEVVEEVKEEVQTEFLVVMSDFGPNRIQVIKAVREQTKESLMVARDMVTNLGQPLQEGMSEADAIEFASKLTAVGATAEVK